VKIGIVFNADKLSGKLTKFFTGEYAYHALWVDEEAARAYDMHWIRRRRAWPMYKPHQVVLFEAPSGVTRDYLERMIDTDEHWYGVKDYLLFALRPLFHLFGRSTVNAGGVICSEMLNIDIWMTGGETPWHPHAAPPSPADLYRWLKKSTPPML
jgi:hypothetical protein